MNNLIRTFFLQDGTEKNGKQKKSFLKNSVSNVNKRFILDRNKRKRKIYKLLSRVRVMAQSSNLINLSFRRQQKEIIMSVLNV